ncbi:lipid II flippase MurJ, partial [Klebsiella pneumoniae]|nr:lipid II flippase MurJ [Klebsiella pneumoniae]
RLLINVPIAIASAMASSLIPTLVADYTKKDLSKARRRITISIKVNMIIAFPCALGLTVLGTPIVRMLFPS